ncbi:hypothetical protein FHW69_003173 [Luteibacter sp. Sphag1AF]|uniref:hypothetical protein n=1 Tax=Luteibacter sp. Sphag1AF TaxID=2587031 RepID=UPI001618CDA0|nr:hypothetical protein [Luteibacter sp. Sphag1AF]MBB3228531.1 hypothetical protein [Luteibacter sp. Sphag1AF]
MLQLLKDAWLGSEPVRFESGYNLAASVARLKAATSESIAWNQSRPAGRVTNFSVELHREIPLARNSFKTVFQGQFQQVGGRTVLTGRFGLHWLAKVFMLFWVAMTAAGVIVLIDMERAAIVSFGAMLFGIALMCAGLWFARHDARWLTGVIGHALSVNGVGNPSR